MDVTEAIRRVRTRRGSDLQWHELAEAADALVAEVERLRGEGRIAGLQARIAELEAALRLFVVTECETILDGLDDTEAVPMTYPAGALRAAAAAIWGAK